MKAPNSNPLTQELNWFRKVLLLRLEQHQNEDAEKRSIYELDPTHELDPEQSFYGYIVAHYQLGTVERLLLLLALIPRLKPDMLLPLAGNGQVNPSFGCLVNTATNQVLPTRQTAYFLLAENNLGKQFRIAELLSSEHVFFKHHILEFAVGQQGGEGALAVTEEYFAYLTTGGEYEPEYSMAFPAKRITTSLEWEDLVLPGHVRTEIEDIKTWVEHGDTLMNEWQLNLKVRKGYRAMFHGKPGTGKTLTATLLGKVTKRPVYRVDLSMTVSKYIGETEKNLKNLFDQAENKDWILFFDEADALFSRRVDSRSSNDRHANQQVAYLLQRVEDYNGLVILASNLRQAMDDAFARRFESIINFPMPDAQERLKLWENYFTSTHFSLDPKIDFATIAEKYEVTGGSIISILKMCAIRAIGRNSNVLILQDVLQGIRKVFQKEGKSIRV